MLTGEHRVSLDDKGRLMIPTKLRSEIPGNTLVLTKGIDQCLWLFPPSGWNTIAKSILENTSMFQQKGRMIQRRIIAPAVECEYDKAGRITVSSILREHAGLTKDCIVLGIRNYLEIWDAELYAKYEEQTEEAFSEIADDISIMWPKD
jgi:MraZ protein